MGTINSNFLPASTGLTLGNENQKWIAYIENLFVDVVQSGSSNSAATGTFRLASTDTISWRNSANTADVTLSKTDAASTTTPADTLVFSGSGIEGPFLSHNLNPASAGELRLASTDVIYFRNNANTGDIVGLAHQTDDSLTVGGAAGIGIPGPATVTGDVSLSGNVSVVGQLTAPNIKATSIITAGSTSSTGTDFSVVAGNGGGANSGGGVSITAGNAGTSAAGGGITLLTGQGGTLAGDSGDIALNAGAVHAGNLGTITTNTTISTYNNIATAGQGVVPVYGITSQKSETAADTNVLTVTPPAAVGLYRISFSMAVSAQNTATLGWTATWTDSNAHAQSPTNLSLFTAGTAAPALTVTGATNGVYYGSIIIDTDNSATAIVVKLTFSGTSFTAKVSATVERIV